MRRGLVSLITVLLVLAAASPIGAQTGGGREGGGTGRAHCELFPDRADCQAESSPVGSTGGGGGVSMVCEQRLVNTIEQIPLDDAGAIPTDFWSNPPEDVLERGFQLMWVRCRTLPDGESGEWRMYEWAPGEPAMRTEDLVVIARTSLPFPLPAPRLSPSPDDVGFLLVNFENWVWVDNWETISASASALDVTVTVTAEPVRLEWDWPSSVPHAGASGSCADGSVAYDRSRPLASQSTSCLVVFHRPSAREPDATYQGTVSVVYHVTWTSNIGESGDLGEVTRSTPTPVRVGEQQVLNR